MTVGFGSCDPRVAESARHWRVPPDWTLRLLADRLQLEHVRRSQSPARGCRHVEQIRDRADRSFRNPTVMLFLPPANRTKSPPTPDGPPDIWRFVAWPKRDFIPPRTLSSQAAVPSVRGGGRTLSFSLSLHAARCIRVQRVDPVKLDGRQPQSPVDLSEHDIERAEDGETSASRWPCR